MKTFLAFFIAGLIFIAPVAFAADNYTLLESLGPFAAGSEAPPLSEYLAGLFIWMIRVAAILSVVMLIVAGVEYTSSGITESRQAAAKTKIWNVVIGLLGVISAYFVLQIVNPALVEFKIDETNFPPLEALPGAPSAGINRGTAIQPGMTAENGIVIAKQCLDCGSLSGAGLRVTGKGDQINKAFLAKLIKMDLELSGKNVDWSVTEAYPPEYPHLSTCHAIGTCIDANPLLKGDTGDLNAFAEAAKNAGLSATFEVKTEEESKKFKKNGFKYPISVNTGASGSHFHVK